MSHLHVIQQSIFRYSPLQDITSVHLIFIQNKTVNSESFILCMFYSTVGVYSQQLSVVARFIFFYIQYIHIQWLTINRLKDFLKFIKHFFEVTITIIR